MLGIPGYFPQFSCIGLSAKTLYPRLGRRGLADIVEVRNILDVGFRA